MSVEQVFGRIMTAAASLIILAGVVSAVWMFITVGVPGLNSTGRALVWMDIALGGAAYGFLMSALRYRRRTQELPTYWELLLSKEKRYGSERRVQVLERAATACWIGAGVVLLWFGLGVSRGLLSR